jgi:DNA-binding MarR family transcriptional regulator
MISRSLASSELYFCAMGGYLPQEGDDMPRKQTKLATLTRLPEPRLRKVRTAARPQAVGGAKIDARHLENFIGYMIRRAQLAVFDAYSDETADMNITTAEFSVMLLARDNPGLSQAALCETLGVEHPRMVVLIDDLERRELVTRIASTVDRRVRAIYLTSAGRSLLGKLNRRVIAYDRHMVKRLRGDDKETLLRMLRNLARPL